MVVVADEQTLDDPRDLTEERTAQTGFYTHRGLDGWTSSDRPGVLTPATPSPGLALEAVDGPGVCRAAEAVQGFVIASRLLCCLVSLTSELRKSWH
jgi:hypothetical protein